MIGCINIQLGRSEKRKALAHLLIDRAQVDLAVVTETRFLKDRGEELMKEIFNLDYEWYGRERRGQRSSGGEGGVGILVRKGTGEVKLLKVSDKYDVIWVEVNIAETKVAVAGVYLSPECSKNGVTLEELLEELEEDMTEYRRLDYKIIVMGDFNRRIGNLPSAISSENSRTVFKRNSQDIHVTRQVKRAGRLLVETMNAWDMLIMNGIDSGGEYTYERKGKKGTSVIDYIMLDKELVEYEYEQDDVEDDLDYKHKTVQREPQSGFKEGVGKLCYKPNSMTWEKLLLRSD